MHDDEELYACVAHVLREYAQPELIEEYVWGREVTLAIAGSPAQVLGVMEIRVLCEENGSAHETTPVLYSLEAKREWQKKVIYDAPAKFSHETLSRLHKSAMAAFHALGCRDIARLDYKIRTSGEPVFLEINPLPGLNPVSGDVSILMGKLGILYEKLIAMVLQGALARNGLQ